MTQAHENIVGLDSGILMHPRIWEASGHVNAFNDALIDCKRCKARFRADEFEKDGKSTIWKVVKQNLQKIQTPPYKTSKRTN